MIKRLTLWLMMIGVSLLVACDKIPSQVQVRFDAMYFFQSEEVLKKKKVISNNWLFFAQSTDCGSRHFKRASCSLARLSCCCGSFRW